MIKDIIKKVVNEHQGIKAVDLVIEVSRQVVSMDEFDDILIELVQEGEIVEVEYTLPQMDYRVKSWYLPKNTMVQVSRVS